jgi:hypothetical protein
MNNTGLGVEHLFYIKTWWRLRRSSYSTEPFMPIGVTGGGLLLQARDGNG